MSDIDRTGETEEMLVLFWLFRSSQVALSPPGVCLAFHRVVVGILARVSVPPFRPLRCRAIDGTHILIGALSPACDCGQNNQSEEKRSEPAPHSTRLLQSQTPHGAASGRCARLAHARGRRGAKQAP